MTIQLIRGGSGRVENWVKEGDLFLLKEDMDAVKRGFRLTA